MKKDKKETQNYLELIPSHKGEIAWNVDDAGLVTLELENKGVFNRIAQRLFKKPRVSFIHLDETGSFVWKSIDGKTSISEIGEKMHERFGEAAEPLYERLARYMKLLESYGFAELERSNKGETL